MRVTPTAACPPIAAVLLASALSACSPVADPVWPAVAAGSWVPVQSTTQANLYAVWGSGPQDVWVAGENDRDDVAGTARRWDGVAWREVELPAEPGCMRTFCRLRCVWGTGPDDVWTAGDMGSLYQSVLRWDGSAWSRVPSTPYGGPASPRRGWFACGRGAGDEVWLVGDSGLVSRWDGAEWSSESTRQETGWVSSIWRSEAGGVWAVGVRTGPPGHGFVTHRDPSGWHEALLTGEPLQGVWGAGPSDVWAVGDAGTILRWGGRGWSESPNDGSATLRAVWGSGATDVWAVGDAGTILHWDGHAWSAVPSGTSVKLRAVWGSSATDVWAVGDAGTILHWSP